MRMTSIDADHRKIDPTKLVPKPARHRAGLKSDALRLWRMFAKQFGQGARIGLSLSFEDRSAQSR